MASSEHPQTSHVTKEPPTDTPSVPLPPLPRTPEIDATKFLRRRSRLDALLVAVVVLFAFLVVSFPTTNTDFFRHAAIGRLLVHGEYHFGVDPFVYTAGNTYYVNHSWLFDLLLYGLYQLSSGGAVIVIFKALLMAALALLLLRAGQRPGQSLWIPAVCTALAILVVSPRICFYMQSTCLSFLFLGITICLLTAVGTGEKRWWWLLPPLFALWVNCDSWFFLGPLTVALYLAGEWIQQWLAGEPASNLRTLGLVLVVGVAACLVNPHHVHVLELPPEFGLTAAGDLLEQDQQFYPLFLSPLGKNYYQPFFGLSAAGLAYWPLLLLGLASFVPVVNRALWPRLLVWLGFALLSLYNWRAIPFFAIVAGPITALNWQDFAVARFGPEPRLTRGWRTWAMAGRVLTLVLGLVLLIVTVPGWLQRSRPTFHRIDWSVQVDPSLQGMAEAIHSWREAGLLKDEPNWFSMYPDTANYLAWFAPGERMFLDQSLPFFRNAAQDYVDIRRGLEQMADPDWPGGRPDWPQILHDRNVRYWIYDDRSQSASNQVTRWILLAHPQEWDLCYLKGRIGIFAWRDPQRPGSPPPTELALDLKRAAFGPAAETAPPQGSEPAPPRDFWQTIWEMWWAPDPPHSSDREGFAIYDYRFQTVEYPMQIYVHSRTWQTAVAAMTIPGSLPGGLVPTSLFPLSWSYTYNDIFPPGMGRPTRPPSKAEEPALQARGRFVDTQFLEAPSLYLAVRAARRALRVNPEDGPTYFRLGQAYQLLRNLPQERQLRRLPGQAGPLVLDVLRRTQVIAAFYNCLRLQPDDDKAAQAHFALYQIYRTELNYIDAAVHHLREGLERQKTAGPRPGISPTQYDQFLEQLSAELARLDTELGRRTDRYEVNAASKSGLQKVQAALQEGLSETALSVLEQEADPDVTNPAQVMLIKVLTGVALDLGMLDKARQLLPNPEGQLIPPEDTELHLRLAAARGDYAEADRLLDDALHRAWQAPPGQMRMTESSTQVAPMIGRALLAEARHLMGSPTLPWTPNDFADIFRRSWLGQNPSEFWRRRWRMEAIINGLIAARQQGDWELARGWLALEAGHCVQARKHFQTVHDLAVPAANWAPEVTRLSAWLDEQAEPRGMQQTGFHHAILYDQSTRYLNWLNETANP